MRGFCLPLQMVEESHHFQNGNMLWRFPSVCADHLPIPAEGRIWRQLSRCPVWQPGPQLDIGPAVVNATHHILQVSLLEPRPHEAHNLLELLCHQLPVEYILKSLCRVRKLPEEPDILVPRGPRQELPTQLLEAVPHHLRVAGTEVLRIFCVTCGIALRPAAARI